MKRLILASASSVRARLLAASGVRFEEIPADINEDVLKQEWIEAGENLTAVAVRLAACKARRVAATDPDAVVIGADQILSLEGEVVSKCVSRNEAESLLRRLRGRTHELVGGTVLIADGKQLWERIDVNRMVMREFSDGFLEDYLTRAGAALLQSVGCYEFEALGAQLFERVEGEFFSILGLPLLPLLAELRDHGVLAR
jgi:septum formation protein